MPNEPLDDLIANVLEALEQGNPEIRRGAARMLGQIADDEKVIAPLIEALSDPDAFVRLEAANALGRIGKKAIPALIASLQEREPDSRKPFLVVLGKIHGGRAAVGELGKEWLEEFDRTHAVSLSSRGKRLIVVQATLDRILLPGLIIALLAALVAAGLGTISFQGTRVFEKTQDVALAVAGAWAFIGASLGAILGSKIRGRLGALVGAISTGLGGAFAGFLIGGLFALLLGPLVKVLGKP